MRKAKRVLAFTIAAFAVSVVAISSLGSGRHRQSMLPNDVVGEWTTTDPRYQGRVMELSRAFVIIITSERQEPTSVQMINRVESDSKGGDTEFTIYSTDYSQKSHFEMKLRFNPENGGEIRFGNHSTVWTRQVKVPASKPVSPPHSKPAKSR